MYMYRSTDHRSFCDFKCRDLPLFFGLLLGILSKASSSSTTNPPLPVEEESVKFKNWMEITMFNWTNSHDVHNTTVKPFLTEMGPYIFRERYGRANVTHHRNGTITFNQIRTWQFMPKMSNGSLDDEITNLNVVSNTVAYAVRDYTLFQKLGANALLDIYGGSLFVTKKVGELLFDGYYDPLLEVLRESENPVASMPFDKFGWFVERNGSWSYDGEFNMYTGENDISKREILHLWNGKSTTRFYSSGCSQINGTTGRLWPPNLNTEKDLTVFLTDICRSISLKSSEEVTPQKCNLQASQWIGDEQVFDNGENYPPNMCFCTGRECPDLKPGVLNISDCRFGFPAFVSYPHFYLADPSFSDAIDGLNSSKKKHEFSVVLEAITGIPLEINARLQMNILLQPISGLTMYANVPHVMIPMFWFTQGARQDINGACNSDDSNGESTSSSIRASLLRTVVMIFFTANSFLFTVEVSVLTLLNNIRTRPRTNVILTETFS